MEPRSSADKIDFHTHTEYSDGALGTAALIEKARAAGITTLAICDHDSVSALAEAERLSRNDGITTVPGIEITSRFGRFQLHFLGFFFDYTDSEFSAGLDELKEARIKRARKIVAKLNRIKIPLRFERVLETAGENSSVGRPHIANTMVEDGYARSYEEVFHKYIGIGRPAYEANYPFPPERALALIAKAGGLSFLAHPSHYVDEDLLRKLLAAGLDGIEVIHPSHTEEEVAFYNKFADDNSLLKSGGSDFHGGLKNDDESLGKYLICHDWVNRMLARLQH